MGASGRCGGLAGTIERVAAYGARARHAVVVYALRAMQVNRVRVTIARNANGNWFQQVSTCLYGESSKFAVTCKHDMAAANSEHALQLHAVSCDV